ncbi:MAG: hypothetical protein ABMA64_25010 [Myxococcota bacterium]
MKRQLGWVVVGLVLGGCPNGPITSTTKPTGTDPTTIDPPTTTDPTATGWCKVQGIFNAECLVCHDAATHLGDLDLETDPYAAVVNVTSGTFGNVLVAPGDPDGSLLYTKMAGTQQASEGAVMPTSGTLDAARVEAVRQWILDGATSECDEPIPTDTGAEGPYHPSGWDDEGSHGRTSLLGAGADDNGVDCRDCHGPELDGGTSGVSCDSCHEAGWRDNCTYCHGGDETPDGAPPTDIDGAVGTSISFPDHTAHVVGPRHPAYDCTECHSKPNDALTPGHWFDDVTPGRAELDFTAGISSAGAPSGASSCGNLWCHGDGAGDNGEVSIGEGPLDCTSCHSTGAGLNGEHGEHLGEGVDCEECHGDVNGQMQITDDAEHVNGTVSVDLPGGISWDGNSCDGSCHFENHNNRNW